MKHLLFLFTLCCALKLHAADKPKIVTFSTVLTEIAERVAQDHAEVIGLVKPGVDPHEYEPRPADLKLVAEAQLVLLSAKHMEGYVNKLQEATGTKGVLLQVGDKFPSLKMPGENGRPGAAIEDPHWWQTPENVKRATKVVQDSLTQIAPDQQTFFAANAAAYTRELDALDKWARAEITKLPRDQRKLVTSHDAFQYFARAYGFTIYHIEGVSSEDQPSSKGVAELIATIKREQVKAVFLESILNPKVTQEITRESGAKIGGTLYADGLGTGEAATYAGMFRHNVQTIVTALQ
jgi:ABC-type Zn uptake system ZnuABC Zn-binding protein ZnuA